MLPPVGVLDEMPQDITEPVHIHAGGLFLALTDGIFESMNAQKELFGIEMVCKNLEEHRQLPPRQAIEKLYEQVRIWQGNDIPLDDQTIVLIAPRA
jgi:serine phosphatase RsbU (regulator of sigma subunit)